MTGNARTHPLTDELGEILKAANAALADDTVDLLGAAVFAADWRPRVPNMVDDVDVLDRYPIGTVVRRIGDGIPDVWQRVTSSSFCWSPVGSADRRTSEDLLIGTNARYTVEVLAVPCR